MERIDGIFKLDFKQPFYIVWIGFILLTAFLIIITIYEAIFTSHKLDSGVLILDGVFTVISYFGIMHLIKNRGLFFKGIRFTDTGIEAGTLKVTLDNIKLAVKKKDIISTKYFGSVSEGLIGELNSKFEWQPSEQETKLLNQHIGSLLTLKVALLYVGNEFSVNGIGIEKDNLILCKMGLEGKITPTAEFVTISNGKVEKLGLSVREDIGARLLKISSLLNKAGLNANIAISILPTLLNDHRSGLYAYGLVGGLIKAAIDVSDKNKIMELLENDNNHKMLQAIAKENNWTIDIG